MSYSKTRLEEVKLHKLWTIIGSIVTTVVLVISMILFLYWAIGKLEYGTLRLLSMMLILLWPAGIAMTWLLASSSAREHLKGFDRGLTGAEKTIESVTRGLSATARLANAKRQDQQQNYNNLLPNISDSRMQIVQAQPKIDEVVDL